MRRVAMRSGVVPGRKAPAALYRAFGTPTPHNWKRVRLAPDARRDCQPGVSFVAAACPPTRPAKKLAENLR